MTAVIDWVVGLMSTLGAIGVGIAILLENIFPPIPSEVILPLAGFTVSQDKMSFAAALVWATIGSVVGGLMLYWVGRKFGAQRLRAIAERMPLTQPSDVDASLRFFTKYGTHSVFFGRFVPGVRSLISIPAGVNAMPLWQFIGWTALGSFIWNAVLIGLGVWLGAGYEKVGHAIDQFSSVIYAVIALAIVAVIGFMIRRSVRAKKDGYPPSGSPNEP
ncbi:DedA family protein [Corynebacterium endometrii]|uniref:VTT domain-containing protein n=1 Tax=Corynebacterium endometrii TaxID=2488819 RepID=A0A4P7QF48_9CORY|nr:DedA family protein [Corynebacterium endometrii]QCB28010.1 hypothetical protein CENDO_03585 [Corynebacterium endometrii]